MKAVPALIVALKDDDAEVRFMAAISLSQIDPTVIESVPLLIEKFKGGEYDHAPKALGRIGLNDKRIMPALIEALKNPDRDIRAEAAKALSKYGVVAREAIPLLKVLQGDVDSKVYRAAEDALEKIEGPIKEAAETKKKVESLLEQLKDKSPKERQEAAMGFVYIGSPAAK